MKRFHVVVHRRPAAASPGPEMEIDGSAVTTLRAPVAGGCPLAATFEQAVARLERFSRMFVELDGSFVWRAEADPGWQVDGLLFDRDDRLLYVELKGNCPRDAFRRLSAAFETPRDELMIQLVRQAVFLGLEEFERSVWK